MSGVDPAASPGVGALRALPIFLAFFVMGFVDAVGTLVGFAKTGSSASSTGRSRSPRAGR